MTMTMSMAMAMAMTKQHMTGHDKAPRLLGELQLLTYSGQMTHRPFRLVQPPICKPKSAMQSPLIIQSKARPRYLSRGNG